MKNLIALLSTLLAITCFTAQAQSVSYGVSPGASYQVSSVSELVVNVAPGTISCNGSVVNYAGGNFSVARSSTNYAYLDSTANCAPGVKTTALVSTDVPIATIVAGPARTTNITDNRIAFTPGVAAPNTVTTSTSTTIEGLLKGTSGNVAQAVAGTDYQAPLGYTALNKASNLSDVASASTARANLGAQAALPNTLGCLDGYDHLPCVVARVAPTLATGNTNYYLLYTPATAGHFRFCGFIDVTVAGTAGSYSLVPSYTGDGHAENGPSMNATATVTTQWSQAAGCTDYYADANVQQDDYIYAGGTVTGSPTIRYALEIERLQ